MTMSLTTDDDDDDRMSLLQKTSWRKRKCRRRGSQPKPKQSKQPRKLSVEELCEAAEHAVMGADPRHAITLYTVALHKVTDPAQQSDLLEKRAEVHVSLYNQQASLLDYQAALEKIMTIAPPPQPPPAAASAAAASVHHQQHDDAAV
jgi:hypothetical protein